jgi:hypothetical protein
MSMVIPYDLLPVISAQFFTKQQQQQQSQQCAPPPPPPPPAPTFLHLPRQLRLDCLMPVCVLPVPVPFPPPPSLLPPLPAPPTQPAPSRRAAAAFALAHSHPHSHHHHHHPALVIPPAALQADLTTDDPTPPPLAPGQVVLPLALAPAPAQVPLPPSPIDPADEQPHMATNAYDAHHHQVVIVNPRLPSSAEPPKNVLEAIEEAVSSALPIPMPVPVPTIRPRAPPPRIPQHHGRRSSEPLRPLTNGVVATATTIATNPTVHCGHSNGHNGKHVNAVTAKGRSGSNSVYVKGTPTHPILNGVPSTPVPKYTEFATPPPPLPTRAHANGRRPMVVQGPLIGNLLLSSCPGKKGALGGDRPQKCVAQTKTWCTDASFRKLVLDTVRLNGPIKGRGTIYRNLGVDLQRMKDAGVRCIVW